MPGPLLIDGAHGEGGGQILRSALTLAALRGQEVRFTCIRAGRRRPGLAAQHLTAVRASAALCGAAVEGDTLGSQELSFTPRHAVRPGAYAFDVAAAREGGSAGGTCLVLQTVLVPLALAAGRSEVIVQGGTHLPHSPPFDYLRDIWLPALRGLGIRATVTLDAWGWFPVGRGAIRAEIPGAVSEGLSGPPSAAPSGARSLAPLRLVAPGPLLRIAGRAVASNLPGHIPRRMAEHAAALLARLTPRIEISAENVPAACPGTGLFLMAEYRDARAGFSALGVRGKPAEEVAEEAAQDLQAHHASGAAIDRHLADQLLLPLALSAEPSRFTVERVTRHLETNAWVIGQFGLGRIALRRPADGPAEVAVTPGAPPAEN